MSTAVVGSACHVARKLTYPFYCTHYANLHRPRRHCSATKYEGRSVSCPGASVRKNTILLEYCLSRYRLRFVARLMNTSRRSEMPFHCGCKPSHLVRTQRRLLIGFQHFFKIFQPERTLGCTHGALNNKRTAKRHFLARMHDTHRLPKDRKSVV